MTNVTKQTGQHTPGPWRLGANTSVGTFISTEEDHLLVCTVERLMIHEEELANARLVAAAPDLLAACELAEAVLSIGVANVHSDPDLRLFLPKLEAAIAKAKGETP